MPGGKKMFATEIKEHLVNDLIPFWQGLKDEEKRRILRIFKL